MRRAIPTCRKEPPPALGARPDLVVLLKGLLSFLQETERTVEQSREFYEAGGWRN